MKTTNGKKEPLLKRIVRHLSEPLRILARTRYDLAMPMGRACSCTQTLRRAGLQYLSLPMDWIVRPSDSGPDIRLRADSICDGFHKRFEPEDFEPIETLPIHAHNRYLNRHTGVAYLHDFPKDIPFAEAFPKVKEKYERRYARLLRLIGESRHVLLVLVDRPDVHFATPDEDCRYARRRMQERFPHARFDFVHFSYVPDLPYWDLRERTVDGFTDVAFDYRDYTPGKMLDSVDLNMAARYMRTRFAVRDYRSKEELSRHAEK